MECLESEFEVGHIQNALNGAFPQFSGQRENVRGDIPKLSVLLHSWTKCVPPDCLHDESQRSCAELHDLASVSMTVR